MQLFNRKSKERSFHLQCMNVIDTMRKHKSVINLNFKKIY